MHNIDRNQIRRAPYGVYPEIPEAQQQALIEHALELGGPPGRVIARTIPTTTESHTVEVLFGWERLEAFTHKDVYPHAPTLPLGLIDCNAADAAFYAIEYAALDQKAAGLVTSPLLYATAAQTAIDHFSRPEAPWSIQETANALCIARPTLSNRLRLLRGLQPKTRELLQQGLVKPQFAKHLLAERSPTRQEHLATRVARGKMSTRVLYRLVHPGYEPPKTIASPRGRKHDRLGNIGAMERALAERFGSPTTITLDNDQQKGMVELDYHSLSELNGLLQHLQDTIQTDTLVRGTLSLKVDNAREANALLLELGSNTDPELD
tara:strand:+ start:4795 stop:5757 length:963 start_codon:yes stop_codon:yes gene_type:complete